MFDHLVTWFWGAAFGSSLIVAMEMGSIVWYIIAEVWLLASVLRILSKP